MAFVPFPCPPGGGGGDAGADVEQHILCDVGPDGEVLGTALAVYEYDADGNPVGAPTFVDPATGVPYVAQGVLQPCPGEVGCLAPIQFCFQSSATVDEPGRMYDASLTLSQGFNVQTIIIDLIEYPANIVWSVEDGDGTQFASDLQAALQSRFPGQTVTVTPPVILNTCGEPQDFQIHIECFTPTAEAPNLVQLRYNGGRDLIQNPAYLETPPGTGSTDGDCTFDGITNFGGYKLLRRSDAPGGTLACTSVPNRGWETNDSLQQFEVWCNGPLGFAGSAGNDVTPTPRGTPVQEINANAGPGPGGADTIWQTFSVPAAGNFTIRTVVGGRTGIETFVFRLSTGDTNDTGPGDIINQTINAPQVAFQANPWTTFTQTVPLAAGIYTLSMLGPPTASFGGLFTDMRVFQDAPGQMENFTNTDDVCTAPSSTTSVVCQYWQPRCINGSISGWTRPSDGLELDNAAFWAQVPAPVCCPGVVDPGSGGGGGSAGNLVQTYPVCGQVGGVPTTLQRVVVTDQSGGAISDTFIGPDGAPVVPTSYVIGSCTDTFYVNDEILCDANGQFLRKYLQIVNQGVGQVNSFRDFDMQGLAYVPVPPISNCSRGGSFSRILCDDNGQFIRVFIYDTQGVVIEIENQTLEDGSPYVPVGNIIACADTDHEVLPFCDFGTDPPTPFIYEYVWFVQGGNAGGVESFNLARTAVYIPVGPVGPCPTPSTFPEDTLFQHEEILCDDNGPFLRKYIQNAAGDITDIVDHNLDGSVHILAGAATKCPDTVPQVVCYNEPVIPVPCGDATSFVEEPNNFLAQSSAITANPNAFPVNAAGLAAFNNNFGDWIVNVGAGFNGGPTGVDIEYTMAVPSDRVVALRLWNNHGFNHWDADGIGSATLEVRDSGNNLLFTGPLVTANGTAPTTTNFPTTLNDVKTFKLVNLQKINPVGAPNIGIREIQLVQTYEATATWNCGGDVVTALIEGANDGVNLVGSTLTQTNGPHTFTFTAPPGYSGQINTDTPGAFSQLGVTNGAVITVTGNGTYTMALEALAGAAVPDQPLRVGTVCVDCGEEETPVIRDINTGLVIPNAVVVPCLESFNNDPDALDNTDNEFQVLCDLQGTGKVPFLRRFITNGNDPVLFTDTLLDGVTPYAPGGTVVSCDLDTGNEVFHGEFILCDDNGPFIRKLVQNADGTVESVMNFDLGGLTYTPVGPVTLCDAAAAGTNDVEFDCYFDNDGVRFYRAFVFTNGTGIPTTVANFDIAGNPYVPVPGPGFPRPCSDGPIEFDHEEEILCDDNGPFIRRFSYRLTDAGADTVNVRNLTLAGANYVPVGTVEKCPEPQPVCYVIPATPISCGNPSGVVQGPGNNEPFTSHTVVSNTNAYGLNSINAWYDGNIGNWGTITTGNFNQAMSGLTIDFNTTVPRDRVREIRIWNNFGGNTSDNDGLGAATVTLFNSLNVAVFGPAPLTVANGPGPNVTTLPGPVDDVVRMRIVPTSKLVNGVWNTVGVREIQLVSNYEATITWDCGGDPVTAIVTGPNAGVTMVGNQITQTNGPHTLTFDGPPGFTGQIVTNNPAAFSQLNIADGTQVILSGNAQIGLDLQFNDSTTGELFVGTVCATCGDDGTPVIRDSNTGDIVPAARVVPCIDANAGPNANLDNEFQILCDDQGATIVPFLRRYYVSGNDTSVLSNDTTLDGTTAYVPSGTVTDCTAASAGTTVSEFLLCDDNGNFIRKFIQDPEGSVIAVVNFTVAGAEYVPVGVVGDCAAGPTTATAFQRQQNQPNTLTPIVIAAGAKRVQLDVQNGSVNVTIGANPPVLYTGSNGGWDWDARPGFFTSTFSFVANTTFTAYTVVETR